MIKSLVTKFYKQGVAANDRADKRTVSQDLSELAQAGVFDEAFYALQLDERGLTWEQACQHYLAVGARQMLDPHPLFDTAYYVESNKDVSFDQINPLIHYLRHGWREGRNPHPLVDVTHYLEKYRDVEQLGVNPLSHFIFSGALEGRDPSPFFSSKKYMEHVDRQSCAEPNPLIHFIMQGSNQGVIPHDLFRDIYAIRSTKQYVGANDSETLTITKFKLNERYSPNKDGSEANSFARSIETLYSSQLFDCDFVRAQLRQTQLSRLDCVVLFLSQCLEKQLEPHPLFDSQFYLENNKDVDFDSINPFVHFLTKGFKEARDPHPLFEIAYYLERSADVRKARINPLAHFMVSGAGERRDPSRIFHSGEYLKALKDIQSEEPDNLLLHFVSEGAAAHLRPHPMFDLLYRISYARLNGETTRLRRFEPVPIESIDRKFTVERVEELFKVFESRLFAPDFFRAQLGVKDLNWVDCAASYLDRWAEEDIDPHPFFDTSFYVERNPDIDFSRINPLVHFSSQGWIEDRNPHPLFDLAYYRTKNKDIRQIKGNPVLHFLRFGALERREFSPFFESKHYEKALRRLRLRNFLKTCPAATKRASYLSSLRTRGIETVRVKQPRNLFEHFVMQDLETMLLPCDNFLFFFDVKPRPSVAAKSGSKFWQLIPRQLDDPEQCGLHGAFASIARRIAQRKLSQTSLATLANLMNSLTFKKDHAGFLEGESTIFLATHEASRTGAPLLLLQLVQQLAMRGWECVVLIDREGEVEDEFARFAHVINFRGRQSKYAECKDYLALLFADLKFHKPKLCLLNSLETGHFAQPLRENGIKVVTFVHELADTYPCAFLKAVFEKSELVVFPAQFVRNSAREKLGIESLNDLVIPSALLDENFGAYSLPQARRELREEIQASENAFVVLACGTPDIRKGIDIFVHVAQVILKKVAAEQEVHFTWIGAGRVINLSPHYYAFWDVRQAALTSRIHLLPPRKNLRPAFRGADLFVLPSRQDPFPCVVHNAMAAELPIVAFQDAGGVQEMLVDGGVKMIPYGDIMAFADAVFSYLTDAEERIRHGKLNAHLVRERFQFSEYISKIENALDLKF